MCASQCIIYVFLAEDILLLRNYWLDMKQAALLLSPPTLEKCFES